MDKPYFYFDQFGMLLITGSDDSWKDAIGRTMEHEYAYHKLKRISPALAGCLYMEHGVYQLKRHPDYQEQSSRDHWSYFIQYMKNTRSADDFDYFIKRVKPMRGMTLWFKALNGNKRAEWWFYTLHNTGAVFMYIIHRLISMIGNLGPEQSNHWWILHGAYMQKAMSKWQKTWRRIWVITTPFYPVQNRAWQLKFLPESPRKERQKKILLWRTDRGNYIVRVLLGDRNISKHEINNYPEMTSDRSGIKLNLSCDRDISKIENTQHCYKRQLLKTLLSEKV